jgi:branched-subunit amino acid ABC-type transport system permease component
MVPYLGMGIGVIVGAFVEVVIGGLGSIPGSMLIFRPYGPIG